MDRGLLKSFSFAVFCGVFAFNAAVAVSVFSDYGQIQNVQNYSTNPFWSPGSPYNQRIPQPVYVQGTDLKTADCLSVVQPLIAVQCSVRDNCKNTSLSDIRPAIMVQLSSLPNHNYVSACSGYIDSIFESYVAQYGNSLPNRVVDFPKATAPSYTTTQTQTSYKAPTWKQEINARSNELQQLQRQNGAGSEHLTSAEFPGVYEDLSFTARMELQSEGYEPFKDLDSYIIPDFKDIGDWCMGEGQYTDMCKNYGKETEVKVKEKEEITNKNCISTITDPHATKAEYDANNICKIIDCKPGWKPNQTGDKCEELSLCSQSKKFELSESIANVFENIQVTSENVAKRLVEEYIKCSTTPNLTVPDSDFFSYTSTGDDYIYVYDGDTKKYDVKFDDIRDGIYGNYTKTTFKALCIIAAGHSDPSWLSCSNITKQQFDVMKLLLEELLGKDFIQTKRIEITFVPTSSAALMKI